MTALLFVLAGVATGVVQATLLASATGARPNPLALIARIALVGLVLVVAARAGHLVAGAVGWALGLFAATALSHRRFG